MSDATFSPKEIAVLANTTAKRMRSFIRAQAEKGTPIVSPVGSGARYEFTKDEAQALVNAFSVRRISSGSPSVRSADELHALVFGADASLDDPDALACDDDDNDSAPSNES